MLLIALLVASSIAAGAALALLRRRGRRPGPLSPALDPLPAGVKHLASTVSDLSDLGLHLRAARGDPRAGKARLGALLDLRQH
jgi:hypothetical protein